MSDQIVTTLDEASVPDEDSKVFLLGLTMAGAVSAGAYTAGVLDFLMQALDAHQTAFEKGRNKKDSSDADAADNANSPPYKVVLKVMSGTSAGGVCTALTVPALVSGLQGGTSSLPLLHDIWVKRIDLLENPDNKRKGLLSLYDIKNNKVRSALNSLVFDDISKDILTDVQWAGAASAKGFVAENLELFVTSTNVDGIPYFIPFSGGRNVGHTMNYHAHVAHYRVEGLGKAKQRRPSPWLERWNDEGLKIALPAQPKRIDFTTGNEGELRESALCTGAFPVGLAGRMITVSPRYYGPGSNSDAYGGAWPVDVDPNLVRPKPNWTYADDQEIRFFAVDGGVCNNEPFELARFTLRSSENDDPFLLKINPRKKEEADRAIIMIDPFPDSPEHVAMGDDGEEPSFAGIIAKLKATLLDQARFKIGELIAAADKETRSRFLISPSRERAGIEFMGAEALASGFLGGFGGFFDEKFRQHDYDLGRRNCQRFLMEHFTIAKEHKTFCAIPCNDSNRPTTFNRDEVTVLSLPAALREEILQPQWPSIRERRVPDQDNNENTLDEILDQMELRVRAVAGLLIEDTWRGMFGRTATRIAWWGIPLLWKGFRGQVNEYLRRTIKSELIRRNQLAEYREKYDSEEKRHIISVFYAPGNDLRTASGICLALRKVGFQMTPDKVDKIIEELAKKTSSEVWKGPILNGLNTYAHVDWKPSLPRRIWGVRTVHEFMFGETTVDA